MFGKGRSVKNLIAYCLSKKEHLENKYPIPGLMSEKLLENYLTVNLNGLRWHPSNMKDIKDICMKTCEEWLRDADRMFV